ncbi:hypothetical protein ZWY2020_023202 [Hordeum vulgare]|nr:hypothetical protein ZWY2020_023202 [Hordeum vulgare]
MDAAPSPPPPSSFAFARHGAARRQRRGGQASSRRALRRAASPPSPGSTVSSSSHDDDDDDGRHQGIYPAASCSLPASSCSVQFIPSSGSDPCSGSIRFGSTPLPSARHARPGATRRRQQQSDARRALAVALRGGAHHRQGQVLRPPRRHILRQPSGRPSKKNKEYHSEEEDEDGDSGGQDNDDPSAPKRPRVVWSVELHRKFVAAVNHLGIDKAVPKRILELMNVEKLTRENIAFTYSIKVDLKESILSQLLTRRIHGLILPRRRRPPPRSLTEVSEARVQVSPQDTCYGLNDSLVSITGSLDKQLQAIFPILFMLLEYVNYTFTYTVALPDTSMQSPDEDSCGVQGILTIGIADEHVGAVISRAGRTIKEIKQVSGAWITISPKGEFMPGTCDREVFITGTSEAIHAAEAMIMRRVSVASGKGDDELTWWRVEGRGGEIKSRLDEQADGACLQLSDGSDTE